MVKDWVPYQAADRPSQTLVIPNPAPSPMRKLLSRCIRSRPSPDRRRRDTGRAEASAR
jgi:hypothetical protein